MPAPAEVFVFAGPTLASSEEARALVRGLHLRKPAGRLDIPELVAAEATPGVIALVDGIFHDHLAVGHAELRDAMAAGWQVWGLSSMGAIRAREMEPLGMRGYGKVFRRFVDEEDFQDDEVTLLHETEAPYRAVTEPLVHLRIAIDHLVARALLPGDEGASVIAELKSLWYGERTVRGTFEAIRRRETCRDPRRADLVRTELADFQRFRIKARDLEEFLRERPWQ